MQLGYYIGRLERAVENPHELTRIQDDADADTALSDDDRSLIVGRASMYLADNERSDAGA